MNLIASIAIVLFGFIGLVMIHRTNNEAHRLLSLERVRVKLNINGRYINILDYWNQNVSPFDTGSVNPYEFAINGNTGLARISNG